MTAPGKPCGNGTGRHVGRCVLDPHDGPAHRDIDGSVWLEPGTTIDDLMTALLAGLDERARLTQARDEMVRVARNRTRAAEESRALARHHQRERQLMEQENTRYLTKIARLRMENARLRGGPEPTST